MLVGSQEFIFKFKKLFEEEKKKLIFSDKIIDSQFNVQPEEMKDEADFSSYELDNQMRMRLRNREALYLRKINEALKRIEDGSFGYCQECEEPIEMKRLEARPTCLFCIACKESSERSERVHIDGHQYKSLGSAKIGLA